MRKVTITGKSDRDSVYAMTDIANALNHKNVLKVIDT